MYWVFRVDLCEFHQWRRESNMQLWRLGSFESQSKKNFKHFPAQILRWSVGQRGSSENRPRLFNGGWSRSPLKGSVWGDQFPFLRQTQHHPPGEIRTPHRRNKKSAPWFFDFFQRAKMAYSVQSSDDRSGSQSFRGEHSLCWIWVRWC